MEQQKSNRINLAIISPNKEAFSETFIAAHRNFLPFNIFFYYGGYIPKYYNETNLRKRSFDSRAIHYLRKKLMGKNESLLTYNLKRSLKDNNIHVVLAEHGPVGASMWEICKELDLPLVVHFFGFDAYGYDLLAKYKESYLKLFNYATRVLSVSNEMTDKLVSLGCVSDKILYNPCGPHEDFFDVSPAYHSNTFISMVRFVDKKAPYYTIIAFEQVLREFPDIDLIMGGDGPLLNCCKNIARYFGIESKVQFPGVLDRQSYINHFKNSLCYVQHSVTADNGDKEGTPVIILEASAAGLPVISTRHGGISDVIIEGETGFLVDEHDVQGMAEKMIYILKNRNRAREMGTAGKANVKMNFSMSKHINKLKITIDEACSHKLTQ
jgi:colanic acid/amylovoran biosynthesis glycosyltransferase